MFAVTTTTNVASTAKTCFSGKKTTSSSRKSFSSISVKASSKSSEEKFDRREMLKNALVASVATVVATPKPVRANESSSRSSFRLLCAERALSLYIFLSRGSFARFYSSLVDRCSRFLDLSSLSSLFEKLRRRVKAAHRECECDIFLLFLLFPYQKLTSKRSIFRKTNHEGARVVRHRRKVGREVRRGHDGCHRASSRSFGLPDGRRRERTVHRKDESVDERVGREVQKIWGLFR